MYKDKRSGTIYTDVYQLGSRLACKVNRIHPNFRKVGHPFTHRGIIYVEVRKQSIL